jgi:hypothetical protein
VRRLHQSLRDSIAVLRALPGRVVTVNPAMMPSPMTWDPIPADAVIIVPRTVVVISAIADLDIDSEGLGSHRSESPRAKERGQQHSKFVFHMFSLVRVSTEPGRILFEGSPASKALARPPQSFVNTAVKPKPAQSLPAVPPTCHARESNPAGDRPHQLPGC